MSWVISPGQVNGPPPPPPPITFTMAEQVEVAPLSLVTSTATVFKPVSEQVKLTVAANGLPANTVYPPQSTETLNNKSSAFTVAFPLPSSVTSNTGAVTS